MLLAVNVGNKNVSFAVFESGFGDIAAKFTVSADKNRTSDEYFIVVKQLLDYAGIDKEKLDGAVMASVVPQLNDVIKSVVQKLINKNPLVVGPGVKTGFAIRIDDPAELGADIVANAAAAVAILKAEKAEVPAIILDMGTVTTLFVINKNREVVGGAIIPGVDMSLDALHRETAQLPNIELSSTTRAIGKNTKASLTSGVILGQAAMIDGLIDRFEKEIKCSAGEAIVFATGDKCRAVTDNCRHAVRYYPELTLCGLAEIYKKIAEN